MEREVIRVIDSDGTQLDVELISILEKDKAKYLIYTKWEKQKSGNLILYIARLRVKEGKYYLENILSDEEWKKVKSLLSSIIDE